ncbi:Hypothetical protein PBC10988_19950 [Planctomycetales bacterium 10988]|nr:Hypothetical protein PBC10988_19950 [Planctomycetales bacterium 10988]
MAAAGAAAHAEVRMADLPDERRHAWGTDSTMRLTLRTLLAYLDDLLAPTQVKQIGRLIERNSNARKLLSRMNDVMRRPTLGVPDLSLPNAASDSSTESTSGEFQQVGRDSLPVMDPNLVAEYLDHTMPRREVPDFEQHCTESDVYLAEVAASHRVLALALGEPAEVSLQSRQKVYEIGTANKTKFTAMPLSESKHLPNPEAVASLQSLMQADPLQAPEPTKQATLDRAKPQIASKKESPQPPKQAAPAQPAVEKLEKTDNKERLATRSPVGQIRNSGENKRTWLPLGAGIGGVLLLVVGCMWVFFGMMAGDDSAETSQEQELVIRNPEELLSPPGEANVPITVPVQPSSLAPDESTEPPQPTEEAEKASESIYSAQRQATEAEASEDPRTPVGYPSPPMASEQTETPKTISTINPHLDPAVLPASHQAPASQTPPPRQPELVRPQPPGNMTAWMLPGDAVDDVQLLLRYMPEVHGWEQVANDSPLQAGDLLLAPPGCQPQIVFRNGLVLEILPETVLELGSMQADGSPKCMLWYGRLLFQAPQGPAGCHLEVTGWQGSFDLAEKESVLGIEAEPYLPKGMDSRNQLDPPRELFAYLFRGNLTLETVAGVRQFQAPRPLVLSATPETNPENLPWPLWGTQPLQLTLADRHARHRIVTSMPQSGNVHTAVRDLAYDPREEVRYWAARWLGNFSDYVPMVRLIDDTELRSHWRETIIAELRQSLAYGQRWSERIYLAFEHRYGKEAEELYQLLLGCSEERLEQGYSAELVHYLEDDRLAFRALSFFNLTEITGMTLHYQPELNKHQNQKSIRRWQERLRLGQIVPDTRQTKTSIEEPTSQTLQSANTPTPFKSR